MELYFIEAFQVYFVFFILIRKWNLHVRIFENNDFVRNLLNCSFCVSFWLVLGASYVGLFYYSDLFVVPLLTMIIDGVVSKLNG